MTSIIRVHGVADGTEFGRPLWVETYNLDSPPSPSCQSIMGRDGAVINGAFGGTILLTADRKMARQFESHAEAMAAWNTQSQSRPLRPDGRPNKPMTALTVEIEPGEPS